VIAATVAIGGDVTEATVAGTTRIAEIAATVARGRRIGSVVGKRLDRVKVFF
jgi:hypothetical protein